ncbi:MAG: hypothetical protein LUD78_10800 [Clostridiales bacterium]|nr:hypothetical protein [Clostridiales bacterium]
MEKLTFQRQFLLCVVLVLCGFLLAALTNCGVFSNVGWVAAGLLFVVHPVCLPNANNRTAARIGGGIVILLGLVLRFRM